MDESIRDELRNIMEGIVCLAAEGPEVESPLVLFQSIIKEASRGIDLIDGKKKIKEGE